jgi:lipopolysaccharide transport system permease protein
MSGTAPAADEPVVARSRKAALAELLLDPFRAVRRYRGLIWDLTKWDIADRYTGEAFGAFWFIGQPLLLMGLYLFIFGFVFPARYPAGAAMPADFTTYILSGLVPWLTCAQTMAAAPGVVINHANLVKQVIFPVEMLVVKTVLSIASTQLLTMAITLGYIALAGQGLPWTALLLPVLFALQIIALTGLAMVLAAAAVYFRDLKEIIQIFNTVGLFIAPILYQPELIERISAKIAWVLYVNPFSHLIWCYRDLLFHGALEHPWSWLIVTLLSLTTFVLGYRVFARLRPLFGDAL